MNILGIIIVVASAAFSASCFIGAIACMSAITHKAHKANDERRGSKIVVFPPGEDSLIVEDPTYATDYETGKLVLIQDEVYSSDESDDYDGALLSNPYNSPNTPKFQNKGQQTVESDSENEREYFLM